MSTTKFMTATGSNRELHIKRSNEDHVQIRQFDPEFHTHQAKTFFLNPSEAPALCLAILEAAGYGEEVVTDGSPDGHIQVAKYYLYEGVKANASITAEARERAELEAEALELYKAAYPVHADWDWESVANTDKWLAVARRAREMRAEK